MLVREQARLEGETKLHGLYAGHFSVPSEDSRDYQMFSCSAPPTKDVELDYTNKWSPLQLSFLFMEWKGDKGEKPVPTQKSTPMPINTTSQDPNGAINPLCFNVVHARRLLAQHIENLQRVIELQPGLQAQYTNVAKALDTAPPTAPDEGEETPTLFWAYSSSLQACQPAPT